MCITVDEVRKCSLTGEFDALTDQQITTAMERVCVQYGHLVKKAVTGWREIVALQTAHNLHVKLKQEKKGGGGAVTSESFAQVGSRSYSVPQDKDGADWWKASPYGAELLAHLKGVGGTMVGILG